MRKYFLLSAVALLVTNSANATTDYAEVTAKATIEVANEFTCSDIDYGTIVVKQNNGNIKLAMTDTIEILSDPNNDIISVQEKPAVMCSTSHLSGTIDDVVLKNANGDTMTLTDIEVMDAESIWSTLLIHEDVKAGTYTGSFTVTATY